MDDKRGPDQKGPAGLWLVLVAGRGEGGGGGGLGRRGHRSSRRDRTRVQAAQEAKVGQQPPPSVCSPLCPSHAHGGPVHDVELGGGGGGRGGPCCCCCRRPHSRRPSWRDGLSLLPVNLTVGRLPACPCLLHVVQGHGPEHHLHPGMMTEDSLNYSLTSQPACLPGPAWLASTSQSMAGSACVC